MNAGYEQHKNRCYYVRGGAADVAKAGDYNSWFLSPSLTLNGVYPLSGQFELGSFAGVNYTVGFYDDYRETGLGERNLVLDSWTVWSMVSRLAVTVAFIPDEDRELALRAGVSNRLTGSDKIEGGVFRFSLSVFLLPVTTAYTVPLWHLICVISLMSVSVPVLILNTITVLAAVPVSGNQVAESDVLQYDF